MICYVCAKPTPAPLYGISRVPLCARCEHDFRRQREREIPSPRITAPISVPFTAPKRCISRNTCLLARGDENACEVHGCDALHCYCPHPGH